MLVPSRFATVSRRSFVAGASMTAVLGLAACTNDAAVLGSSGGPATTQGRSGTGAAPATTAAAGPASSGSATATSAGAGAAAVAVAFTYKATSGGAGGGPGGGPARNPYIAVWVENASGALVRTVSLWHLQGRDNWLNELKRWYQVSGGKDTGSSATRAAGTYTVAWDLTDNNGVKVVPGSFYLCVEAAREHGPYSLVRQQVDVSRSGKTSLADSGELSGVTVTVA